jgi:hypothetical protein
MRGHVRRLTHASVRTEPAFPFGSVLFCLMVRDRIWSWNAWHQEMRGDLAAIARRPACGGAWDNQGRQVSGDAIWRYSRTGRSLPRSSVIELPDRHRGSPSPATAHADTGYGGMLSHQRYHQCRTPTRGPARSFSTLHLANPSAAR